VFNSCVSPQHNGSLCRSLDLGVPDSRTAIILASQLAGKNY
jgi:hypothetical protein